MKKTTPLLALIFAIFAIQAWIALPVFACDEHENDSLIPLETKIEFLAGQWARGEILGVDCSESRHSGFGFRTTSPEGKSKDYLVRVSYPLCQGLITQQELAREQGVEDIFTTRIYVLNAAGGAVGFDAFLADHKPVMDSALQEAELAEILGKHLYF